MKTFLTKKNIVISVQKYGIDAMSAMAFGLMASLVVGLIIKTWGQQSIELWGDNALSQQFILIGTAAMSLTGAAIGAAIAHRLQAPNLVLFASVVAGYLGYASGGPAGAYVASVIAVETGKVVEFASQRLKQLRDDLSTDPDGLHHRHRHGLRFGFPADFCRIGHHAEPDRFGGRCRHGRLRLRHDGLCGHRL